MARFLLECPHTYEECISDLDSIFAHSQQLLARFDWGCKNNEHVGWAVVEAGDESTARMLLPTIIRAKARVVRLNKFTPEDMQALHDKG